MGTIIDDMIAGGEGRKRLPSFTISATGPLADPERPSFVSQREEARSQFHFLERSLVGPDAKPPLQNPVWLGLMSAAATIRTKQSADAAREPSAAIPDEAVSRTAILTDVGMKRMALLRQLDETAPNQAERESVLRGTATAAVEAAAQTQDNIRRGVYAARSPMDDATSGLAGASTQAGRFLKGAARAAVREMGPDAANQAADRVSEAVKGVSVRQQAPQRQWRPAGGSDKPEERLLSAALEAAETFGEFNAARLVKAATRGAAAESARITAPPTRSGVTEALKDDPGAVKTWETPEALNVREAAKALVAATDRSSAREVAAMAASEAVTGRPPPAGSMTPAATEAWSSPSGRQLRDSVAAMDRVLDGDRKAVLGAALISAANEEGFSGRAPQAAEMSRLPGFREAWESEQGRGLRTSMARVGDQVRSYVRDEMPADIQRPVAPLAGPAAGGGVKSVEREVYDRWSAAAPSPAPRNATRWTDAYDIHADTDLLAKTTRPFVDLALRAHDAGRSPTTDELRRDVAGIRAALSVPERKIVSETSTTYFRDDDGQQRGDRPGRQTVEAMQRHGTKEITTRPAIVGENPFNGHIVGIEGQSWYTNTAAVRDVLKSGGPDKAFVSYAAPDAAFRETLTAAAGEAGIPVVRGRLNISNRDVTVPSSRVMTHVDGTYMGESTRVRESERTLLVPADLERIAAAQERNAEAIRRHRESPEAGGGRGAPRPLPPAQYEGQDRSMVRMESWEGRESTKGKVVIVDVTTPETRKERAARQAAVAAGGSPAAAPRGGSLDFIARINNGALGAPELIAFGGPERNEDNIFKMARRRQLQGMDLPRMIDKRGDELSPDQVASLTRDRGAAQSDKFAGSERIVRDWRTADEHTHLLVAALLPGQPKRQAALLNGYPTIGDALDDATAARSGRNARGADATPMEPERREALFAASAYARAAHPAALKQALEKVDRVYDRVTVHRDGQPIREKDVLADPREAAVAATGIMFGFSGGPGRQADKGSRYAVIGDEGPVSPQMSRQISTLLDGLAQLHGRDEDGVAKVRINTTLTTGVGEEVMKAGLSLKVPVEAYTGKDDRDFKPGSDDLRLLGRAVALDRAGLGGTWSLSPNDESRSAGNASRERAARAAIEGADAIVVSRIGENDPLKMVVAAAGRTKPVAVLPPTSAADGTPEVLAWRGASELAMPDRTIRASLPIDPRHDAPFTVAGATISTVTDRYAEGGPRRIIIAETDTGRGAMPLNSTRDLRQLKAAAAGEIDLRMARGAETGPRTPPRSAPAPAVRWEVMDDVDVSRFHDKRYRETLQLTPLEAKLADATARRYAHSVAMSGAWEPPAVNTDQGPVTELGKTLAGRFKVTESKATRARQTASGGMEV